MDQDGIRHRGRPEHRRLYVRWGPSPPPQKGGGAPQFSAHFYCGQTHGCIKMTLGMQVSLGSGDFVLDGDPTPLPQNWGEGANFWPMFIVTN